MAAFGFLLRDKDKTSPTLKSIGFSNYRSFNSSATLQIKPITMLFGGNSSGKSAVLRLLPYLQQSIETASWSHRDMLNISDLVYQKAVGTTVQFTIELSHSFSTVIEIDGSKSHFMDYKIEMDFVLSDITKALNELEEEGYIDGMPELNNVSRYEFLESQLIISERKRYGKKAYRALIHASFEPKHGELVITDIDFDLNTPLAFEKIFADDEENLVKRLGDNVNGLADVYREMISDFRMTDNSEYIGQSIRKIGHKFPEVHNYPESKGAIYRMLSPYPELKKLNYESHSTLFSSLIGVFEVMFGGAGGYSHQNKKINIPEYHIAKNPGYSDRRKLRRDTKRLSILSSSLLNNLKNLFERAFEVNHLIYIAGLRDILTDTSSIASFAGILNKKTEYGHELDMINRYLGADGIDSSYEIRKFDGLSYEETDRLYKKLHANGFNSDELKNFIEKKSFMVRYELYDKATSTKVHRSEVGLGIVQVLPILANMAYHSKSLFVIEQPELHLHPAQQSKLAQLIVDNIKTNENKFILETHSEHFIKMFQLEIARSQSNLKSTLNKDDVQILYVSKDKSTGGSTLREIEFLKDGSFAEPWPDKFFDVSADITMERLRLTNRN
jgi:predicted ATPase